MPRYFRASKPSILAFILGPRFSVRFVSLKMPAGGSEVAPAELAVQTQGCRRDPTAPGSTWHPEHLPRADRGLSSRIRAWLPPCPLPLAQRVESLCGGSPSFLLGWPRPRRSAVGRGWVMWVLGLVPLPPGSSLLPCRGHAVSTILRLRKQSRKRREATGPGFTQPGRAGSIRVVNLSPPSRGPPRPSAKRRS